MPKATTFSLSRLVAPIEDMGVLQRAFQGLKYYEEAPELAIVGKGLIESYRFRCKGDALALEPKPHGHPHVIEGDIGGNVDEVVRANRVDGAGDTDHAAKLPFVAPDPLLVFPVEAGARLPL